MDGFLEIAGADLSQDAANVNQIHAEFRDSQPSPVTRPRTPAMTSVDESEERNTKLGPVTGSTRKTVHTAASRAQPGIFPDLVGIDAVRVP